jgi:hypothetical protein
MFKEGSQYNSKTMKDYMVSQNKGRRWIAGASSKTIELGMLG